MSATVMTTDVPVKTFRVSDYWSSWKYVKPFVVGGTAGCFATMCVQPIDRIKTAIQAATIEGKGKQGAFQVTKNIIATEGPFGLYKGLSAGLLRQLTYGTTRLGIFRSLTNHYSENGQKKLSFATSTLCSIIAGSTGALVGNPADVALIRMQTQAQGERAYKHVGDCMMRMFREEGVRSFFAGATPTIIRGIALNVGMLASYDQLKYFFARYLGGETAETTLVAASIGSGIIGATFCLPFDLIKTRMQKKSAGATAGGLRAMGVAAKDIYMKNGLLGFYTGYVPFLFRIAPHIVLVWLAMEALNKSNILK